MTVFSTLGFVVNFISVFSLSLVFTILFVNDYRNSKKEIIQGRRDIEFIDKQIDLEKKARQDKINVSLVVGKTTSIVFSVITLAFFTYAIINRINDDKIKIGNTTHIVIATGSMSEKHESNEYLINYNLTNQFAEYSIIEVSKITEPQLYVYDVIAFKDPTGQTIIHRIIDVNITDGVKHYVTRGDANNANDTFEPTFDDIIGRYNGKHVKSIGILVLFMQSNSGIVTVLAVFYCVGLFAVLFEKLEKMKRDRTANLISIIEYDEEDKVPFFDHDFIQNIYYKGFVYRFKNNEFLGKEVIMDPKERANYDSEHIITKTTQDPSGETVVDTKIINPNKVSKP